MKCFKGFDKDLKCRDFQYEIGKEYTEEKADICNCGFHACEFPMDVFGYYPPSDSRYCEVELEENGQKSSDDSKRVGKKISVKAEIGIAGIIKAGVEYIKEQVDWEDDKATNTGNKSAETNTGNKSAATNTGYQSAATNTGDRSAATNTGYRSAATNTGYQSAATNTGNKSEATNTGDYSAATNTGDYSAATNTGDYSEATNTGYQSAATNTGDYSAATNTGDRSAATNTGNKSAAIVEGKESIALATGIKSKAKGKIGCFIVLTEWKEINNEYHIVDIKSAKVDGENIKEDTFYMLKDGKFVEVD
nr:MAG TPA: hypothetical protein [Caudoviricetes sp.]